MRVPLEQLIGFEAEFEHLQQLLDQLLHDAGAKIVILVDKNGGLIASSARDDTLSTVNNGPPAMRFDGRELTNVSTAIRVVADRVILVTIRPSSSTPTLPHDCMDRASDALRPIVVDLDRKVQQAGFEPLFPEVTHEDVNKLFVD